MSKPIKFGERDKRGIYCRERRGKGALFNFSASWNDYPLDSVEINLDL
jgi:hypothetical protein